MTKHQDELTRNLHNNKNQEYRRLLDVIFIIAFVGIGVVGLFLQYDSPILDIKNTPAYINQLDKSIKEDIPELTPEVNVFGNQETNVMLTFVLENWNKNAVYWAVLGDGNSRKFESGKLTHRFTTANPYTVHIYTKQNNRQKLLMKKELNIEEGSVFMGSRNEMPL